MSKNLTKCLKLYQQYEGRMVQSIQNDFLLQKKVQITLKNIIMNIVFYQFIIESIKSRLKMQAQIDPILEILPFDQQYAVRAEINIQKNSQKLFVMKTFMMFVLQIRSAMDDKDIKALKGTILSTCQQLIERGGIDNVGFVINKNYYTIRNPNYEGIKDLLNLYVKVEDTTDIRETIVCLRNSIHAESKKLQCSKISIFMFTSNVAQNPLNPVKKSYRLKMNAHIYNYQRQIARLGNTIKQVCDDCYFYSIGYVKKFNNDKQKDGYGWVGCGQYGKQGIDVYLLYQISKICKRKQFTFDVCDSFSKLMDKFNEISSLILYEFHQFSVMIPLRQSERKQLYIPNTEQQNPNFNIKADKQLENIQLQMQDMQEIEDQQIREFLNNDQSSQQEGNQIDYRPTFEIKQNIKYYKIDLTNTDQTKFTTDRFVYFGKKELDLPEIHQRGYHIFKKVDKKQEIKFPEKQKRIKKMRYVYTPEYVSKNVDFHEPNSIQLIRCQTEFYKEQLSTIICKIQSDIIKYKKRFVGTYKKRKIFETYFEVNQALQNQLREKVYRIQQILKQIYQKVFKDELIKNEKMKRNMFEMYSGLKSMIDTTNQVFLKIYKKQIKNEDINKLTSAINYDKIRSSLRRKLIKRVNSNPKMIDQVYEKVEQICKQQIVDYVDLEAKHRESKSEVGNCMYTYKNFATSLRDRDCLALIFQIERPDTAIADPGRIRIRQVSTLVTGVSKFFEVHQYLIQTDFQRSIQTARKTLKDSLKIDKPYCPICVGNCLLDFFSKYLDLQVKQQDRKEYQQILKKRQAITFGIDKNQYKQNWDYWNRVQSKDTYFGVMPLYVCEQNWKVAKQLMKPCMGWTACGEPLGYTYSQTQTIPFMVLSSLMRAVQQQTYKIQQLQQKSRKSETQKERNSYLYQANIIKHNRMRHEQLLRQTQETCKAIMRDMSAPTIEQPLNKQVIEKYLNYEKPINRTVDIINNNSSFMSQIYTVIKLGYLEKPSEEKFHEFFIRLIEEELRRETDGWNEEEVQQKFINKLLNVKVQTMDKPKYIVFESEYLDRFNAALEGAQILRTEFQIHRQELQMVIKENNKLNDTQRMSIIEYKRLYENRVLWLWYIRFRLYEQKQRISIHKWKCLSLTNYYQLFTMIIQNKKQRKNWKRRQAILSGDYADPFDYYQARDFLEHEFILMRNKKQAQNIVLLHAEKYGKASQVFAMTKDLRQAAGSIMNIQLGQEIGFYYKQLCRQANLIEQKLKILLNGEYEGVQLFKNGWKMSRKRLNHLRHKYPYEFQKYQYMF